MRISRRFIEAAVLVLGIAAFAAYKLSFLHFRFGDEDVYLYMADAVRGGLLPYKNFFFADPPLFPILLAPIKMLIGQHLILYKALPVIFDSLTALVIFLILKRRDNKFAAVGPLMYLFSFSILATSDFVTGAEVAMFFVVLAVYFDQASQEYWSGILWALACLTKLYAAPALIGFLAYKLWQKKFAAVGQIIAGGLLTAVIILLPFIISAPKQLLRDTIIHQFNRPPGISKKAIFTLFLRQEWLPLLLAALGAIFNKDKTWLVCAACSAIFLLAFKDLYYLYLQLLLPFIALLAADFINRIGRGIYPNLPWIAAALLFAFAMSPLAGYADSFRADSVFYNPKPIADALRQAPENYPVYGVQEITPLLALMSGRPIFANIIDTNTQTFASGAHNRNAVSNQAVRNGIYLLARIANYPKLGIRDQGYSGYFSPDDFKYCRQYKSFDSPGGGPDNFLNTIVIYSCKK